MRRHREFFPGLAEVGFTCFPTEKERAGTKVGDATRHLLRKHEREPQTGGTSSKDASKVKNLKLSDYLRVSDTSKLIPQTASFGPTNSKWIA